jgi:hypothetical protein
MTKVSFLALLVLLETVPRALDAIIVSIRLLAIGRAYNEPESIIETNGHHPIDLQQRRATWRLARGLTLIQAFVRSGEDHLPCF